MTGLKFSHWTTGIQQFTVASLFLTLATKLCKRQQEVESKTKESPMEMLPLCDEQWTKSKRHFQSDSDIKKDVTEKEQHKFSTMINENMNTDVIVMRNFNGEEILKVQFSNGPIFNTANGPTVVNDGNNNVGFVAVANQKEIHQIALEPEPFPSITPKSLIPGPLVLDAGLFQHNIPVELRTIIKTYFQQSLTNDTIAKAVQDYVVTTAGGGSNGCVVAKSSATMLRYGHISLWQTRSVTNMCNLFAKSRLSMGVNNKLDFNEDISGWDVSNVYTMQIYVCRPHHIQSTVNSLGDKSS
jgi:hypothetical protein